jgi:hypothetical protein
MKKFILDFLALEERRANRTMELPSTIGSTSIVLVLNFHSM